jgi:hypothetical protein
LDEGQSYSFTVSIAQGESKIALQYLKLSFQVSNHDAVKVEAVRKEIPSKAKVDYSVLLIMQITV